MRCRKNYRDLTTVERDRFVQALHHVKQAGIVDQYASDHDTFFHSAHHSSHFLPWHREFLRRFEEALRTFHPEVSIPYWNSTVDTGTGDPLWQQAFLGQFDAAWSLNRALGGDTLPNPGQVQTSLGRGTYDVFWPELETDIHNPPHRWVGGVMQTGASPGDPVFYLHHCWIDLLWAQWQLLHPGEPFVSSGAGAGLNEAMAPWATTPADVMDHRQINLYHYPPGFQQDPPEVTLETPAVNFIDVPAGETRLAAAVFALTACEPVSFSITAGPSVTSGPAGTVFAALAPLVTVNPALESKARVWLSYLGTAAGDSATGSVTIRSAESGEEWVVPLAANTIARPTAAVVMVLDRSNSMNFESGIAPGVEREDVLKFSAPPAVDVIDDEHAMAVCGFDHDAHAGIAMTPVAGAGKLAIKGAIAAYAPNPNGWTSIGEGVAFAHGILDPVTGYDVKAMVVLTDGQENHGPHTRRYIADVAGMINERVFAIGLGRPEVLNAAALQALCNGSNGYMVMTGDLSADAYFRLAKYYQQILAGVTSNEVVLDPEGWILPGQQHRIPFRLNEADLTAKAILLTPAPYALRYVLETPAGDIIDPAVAGPHPMAAFEVAGQVALYRLGLPIPLDQGDAQAGRWHAVLQVDEKVFRKYLSTLKEQPELLQAAAAHGIRYSFLVQAYSSLRMRARLSQSGYEPGAAITIAAQLTEYGVPVEGRAACRAELTRPDGSRAVLAMAEAPGGIFEAAVSAAMAGVWQFRVLAEGTTMRGRRFSREQTLTGAVWRGGDRPPPSAAEDPKAADERLCRLLHCLLGQKGIEEALRRWGIDPEGLRRCLEAWCRRPDSGEPPLRAQLPERLRALVGDERLLQDILRELTREP